MSQIEGCKKCSELHPDLIRCPAELKKLGVEHCPRCGTFHLMIEECPKFFERPIFNFTDTPILDSKFFQTERTRPPKQEKPMDTDRLKAANANRESLAATLRTATGMEALVSLWHVASTDIRNQSGRTSLHHTKHTQLFKDQLELAYAGFRQAVMAISMAEAARLEEEFKNL